MKRYRIQNWSRCISDLEIMLGYLHGISQAIVREDPILLYSWLQKLESYCNHFKAAIKEGKG